ncbi:hypothetical protein DPMN_025491 [Dreissena polymorpha]|uniref:Uncharacterized protein n=1 Tax=Dreissena polymorpha TaxID=45954 RepID=A0A9D4LRH0_DREPO|nr:hypothetical protein DPMN_025491 [Dreissena polymorpha]
MRCCSLIHRTRGLVLTRHTTRRCLRARRRTLVGEVMMERWSTSDSWMSIAVGRSTRDTRHSVGERT